MQSNPPLKAASEEIIKGDLEDLSPGYHFYDHNNFQAFSAGGELGERLELNLSNANPENATLAEGEIQYHSSPMLFHDFRFKAWGIYEEIGFLGEKYLARYCDLADIKELEESGWGFPDLEPQPGQLVYQSYLANVSESKDLWANQEISKILIDTDNKTTITLAKPLQLEEGYKLSIRSMDITGKKVLVELSKNGQVIDSKIIQPSMTDATMGDKTYYFKKDLGNTQQIVIIGVHFNNTFKDQDVTGATVDGIFQISDTVTKIEVNQKHKIMSIKSIERGWIHDGHILMDNKDHPIVLSRNKDIPLMGNIHIKTLDQDIINEDNPLRYYIYMVIPRKLVTVPNVTKKQLKEAKKILESNQLQVQEMHEEVASVAEGLNYVTKQDPVPGSEVEAGSFVNLTIAIENLVEAPSVDVATPIPAEESQPTLITIVAISFFGLAFIFGGSYFVLRSKLVLKSDDKKVPKKSLGDLKPKISFRPQRDDLGSQDVGPDFSLQSHFAVGLRPIRDPGIQIVAEEDNLIVGERKDNE